jgi:hypothetical protein
MAFRTRNALDRKDLYQERSAHVSILSDHRRLLALARPPRTKK